MWENMERQLRRASAATGGKSVEANGDLVRVATQCRSAPALRSSSAIASYARATAGSGAPPFLQRSPGCVFSLEPDAGRRHHRKVSTRPRSLHAPYLPASTPCEPTFPPAEMLRRCGEGGRAIVDRLD